MQAHALPQAHSSPARATTRQLSCPRAHLHNVSLEIQNLLRDVLVIHTILLSELGLHLQRFLQLFLRSAGGGLFPIAASTAAVWEVMIMRRDAVYVVANECKL